MPSHYLVSSLSLLSGQSCQPVDLPSVVVLEETPCHRGSSRTNLQVLVLGLQVLVLVLVLESSVLDSNSGFNCAYQLKYIWQSLSVQT